MPIGPTLRRLLFERRNFGFDANHLGISIAEPSAQVGELLFELPEPHGRSFHRLCAWGDGQGIDQLLLEPLAALHDAALPLAVHPELRVEPVQSGETDFDLLQLACVAQLEVARALLLIVQLPLDRRELGFEEVGRLGRLPLAALRVLLDVEGGERVGDLSDRPWISAAIAQAECDRPAAPTGWLHAFERQLDLALQTLDEGLQGHDVSEVRVQTQARDDVRRSRATHDLLVNRLNPGLQLRRDGRSHERLGDLLSLDEHRSGGSIEIGKRDRRGDRAGARHTERHDANPLSPAPHIEHHICSKLRFALGMSVRPRCHSARRSEVVTQATPHRTRMMSSRSTKRFSCRFEPSPGVSLS